MASWEIANTLETLTLSILKGSLNYHQIVHVATGLVVVQKSSEQIRLLVLPHLEQITPHASRTIIALQLYDNLFLDFLVVPN